MGSLTLPLKLVILQNCDQKGKKGPHLSLKHSWQARAVRHPQFAAYSAYLLLCCGSCLFPCWCRAEIWLQAGSGQLCPCQGTSPMAQAHMCLPKYSALFPLPSSDCPIAGFCFLTLPTIRSDLLSPRTPHPGRSRLELEGSSCENNSVRF